MIEESVTGTTPKIDIPGDLPPLESDSIPRDDILTAAKGGGIEFAGNIFEYLMRFIFIILVTFPIHYLVNIMAWIFKLKKNPW